MRRRGMLTQLTELIEAHNIFVRERKSNWLRSLGIALLYYGLSCRKAIAIDETKVRVEGMWYYSSSRRRSTRRTKSCHASRSRRREIAVMPPSRFIRRALQACTNTPTVPVDGGPWYAWALGRMGCRRWERVTFGKRNAVEQWFSIFKQRVKRLYRRWPPNACVETVASWCEAFVALYNLRRA